MYYVSNSNVSKYSGCRISNLALLNLPAFPFISVNGCIGLFFLDFFLCSF